jgi:hypothetical protein
MCVRVEALCETATVEPLQPPTEQLEQAGVSNGFVYGLLMAFLSNTRYSLALSLSRCLYRFNE